MNLFKYALQNLKTYKYRTVIMIVTLVLVTTASVVGISIQSATHDIAKKYRDQIGAQVNIELDAKKMMNAKTSPQKISAEQYEKIAQLEYVKNYSYLTELMIGSNTLKAVGEDTQKGEDQMGLVLEDENGNAVKAQTPKIRLIGGAGNADLPEFRDGSRKLVEGEAPKNKFDAMISKEFATLNNIKIGDTIYLNDVRGKLEQGYKVTGIYEDNTIEDGGTGIDMPLFNRRNEVITTFESAMALNSEGINQVRATYEINDPKDFDAFYQAVRDLGVGEDYNISIDHKSFEKAVGPINNLNSTVGYFMMIILLIAAGVLMLLSILSVKERQYEIGVLRAMGMKKVKVGLSFIVESVIVLMIALVIGLGIGSVVTKPVASSLLEQQITAMEKANENDDGNTSLFTPDRSKDVKTVDTIDTSINALVLVKITSLGFGIIILTNIINIIYIMRFQPMEIMRKKN